MDNPSLTPPGQNPPTGVPSEKKDDTSLSKASDEISPDTSPVDPSVIPPPVGKSSRYRNLWLVLIFGLVLSVVGVGAYIIDSENRGPISQISALTTPTPFVARPTATPTPDPMAKWQTYQGKMLRIKYSPIWELKSLDKAKPASSELERVEFTTTRQTTEKATGDFTPGTATVSIVVTKNYLEQEIKAYGEGETMTDTTFQGLKAKQFTFQGGVGGSVTNSIMMTTKNGNTYIFTLSTQDEMLLPQFEEEFSQMLTTLQFVDATATPAGSLR